MIAQRAKCNSDSRFTYIETLLYLQWIQPAMAAAIMKTDLLNIYHAPGTVLNISRIKLNVLLTISQSMYLLPLLHRWRN